MVVIVIADSFKKGMKSRGCAGLLQYNKKNNLFEQQRNSIKKVWPNADIVYIYGFDGKRFETFIENNPSDTTTFLLNPDHEKYSHGKSLSLARQAISNSNECLILLGYEPIETKVLKSVKNTNRSSVLVSNSDCSKVGCVVDATTKNISHLFFDLDNHVCDIYMLKDTEIQILSGLLFDDNTYNMFLFEIMNQILINNGKLQALSIG